MTRSCRLRLRLEVGSSGLPSAEQLAQTVAFAPQEGRALLVAEAALRHELLAQLVAAAHRDRRVVGLCLGLDSVEPKLIAEPLLRAEGPRGAR